jgi:cation transporter-like permease
MPREDIVIGTGGDPEFWPTLMAGAGATMLWSIGSGLLGMVLGMVITRSGLSEMTGFAHLVVDAPVSSALLGAVLWLMAWLLVLALSPKVAFRPEAILWARWIACCLVFLFQAAVWVMLTKLGAQ